MYYIKTHKVIYQLMGAFYQVGMWWRNDDTFVCLKLGTKLIHLIYYVSFLLSLTCGAILSDRTDESAFFVALGLTSVVTCVRLNYILWHKVEICEFINDIAVHTFTIHDEFSKFNKKINKFMQFVYCYIGVIFFGFFAIIILPIFSYRQTLPLNIWFPFDWSNNGFVFWVAYLYGVTVIMFSVIAAFLALLIWYIIMSYSIRYQMLGDQFRKIGLVVTSTARISDEEKGNSFFQDLIDSMRCHQQIQQ